MYLLMSKNGVKIKHYGMQETYRYIPLRTGTYRIWHSDGSKNGKDAAEPALFGLNSDGSLSIGHFLTETSCSRTYKVAARRHTEMQNFHNGHTKFCSKIFPTLMPNLGRRPICTFFTTTVMPNLDRQPYVPSFNTISL